MKTGTYSAFAITEDDVEEVLKAHSHALMADDLVELAQFARDLLGCLDHGVIEREALYGGDLEEQTRYAHEAIVDQLLGLGVLDSQRLEEELTPSTFETMNG